MLAELFMLLFLSFLGITASRCNSNADRVHGVRRRTAHDICVQPAGGHAGRRAVNVGSYGVSCAPPPPCATRQRSTPAPAGTATSAVGVPRWDSRRLPATPLSPHSAFDSLLQGAARSTGIITTIEAEVAGVFSAVILSVLEDVMPFALARGLLLVAAGGLELQGGAQGGCGGAAARRLAPDGSGAPLARLRRLWRRCAARRLPPCHRLAARKKSRATVRHFSRCVYVCACAMHVSDALNSPLHEGMRSVADRDVSAHQNSS